MSATLSEATGRPYGIQRVCQAWERSRSALYARQTREQQRHKGEEPARRGPTPTVSDATLLEAIQADLDRSPFQGEGHRTVHARLRILDGIRVARTRVLRVLRAHKLLSPHRGRQGAARVHAGTIVTQAPNVMWGTDGVRVFTLDDGWGCPREVLAKARPRIAGERVRLLSTTQELVLAARQPQGLERRGPTVCVLAQQHEVAGVRHQHQPVASPVATGLVTFRRKPRVVRWGLHLDDAALRRLPLARHAPLHLLRPVETEVGMACALVGEFLNAEHLRPERRADCRQEVAERSIQRTLLGRAPGRPDSSHVGEVLLDGGRQLRGRSAHRPGVA